MDETGPSSPQGQVLGCALPGLRRHGDQARGATTPCIWFIALQVHGQSCLAAESGGARLGAHAEAAFPNVPLWLSHPVLPGLGSGHQPQPLALHKPVKAPPGSGEAEAVLEVSSVCVCVCWKRGLCGLCRYWGEPLPSPCWAGSATRSLRAQGRGIIDPRSVRSGVPALQNTPGVSGNTKTTPLTPTYPFWISVSSAILRTETSPVVYNLGGGSESFI